jgi:hypothetical protein
MLTICTIHGPAGVCFYSEDLLNLQPDGALPDVITVELKDRDDDVAFFRVNLSPREANKLPIENNSLPFDENSLAMLRRFSQMCGFCFVEKRRALEAQQKQIT